MLHEAGFAVEREIDANLPLVVADPASGGHLHRELGEQRR